MTTVTRNGRISTQVDAIKVAARGRWLEILTSLGGVPADLLDGKHHPCPKCGGTDRFRAFDDFQETGGVYCNQCHAEKNSDGISTLQWATGADFRVVLKMLAEYLIANGNGRVKASNGKPLAGKGKRLAENAKDIKAINSANAETLLHVFCKAKPPITTDGIKKCGGKLVRWCNTTCIRFDGHDPIDGAKLTAIILCRNDGKPFPAGKTIGERKTHSLGGSVNSWLLSGTADEVKQATTILDVEGVSDLLAVVSAGLPLGWVVVTNTAGAKARGKLPREWAAGKRIVVVGDADEPGQDGQRRGIVAYHEAGAAEIVLAQLPYPIEKDHGKDLRDYLLEGRAITGLPMVAATAEQVAEWKRAKVPERSGRERKITIGTDEPRVIDEAIEALVTQENVYQRGGCLVQVVEGTEVPRGITRPKDAPESHRCGSRESENT